MSNNLILQRFARIRVSQVRGSLRSGRVTSPLSPVTTEGQSNGRTTAGLAPVESPLSAPPLPQSLPPQGSIEHCYGAWSSICPSSIVNTTNVNTTIAFSISFRSIS